MPRALVETTEGLNPHCPACSGEEQSIVHAGPGDNLGWMLLGPQSLYFGTLPGAD